MTADENEPTITLTLTQAEAKYAAFAMLIGATQLQALTHESTAQAKSLDSKIDVACAMYLLAPAEHATILSLTRKMLAFSAQIYSTKDSP